MDKGDVIGIGTLMMLFGFILGCAVTATVDKEDFHETAIAANCAHYDGKTGEFKWNIAP